MPKFGERLNEDSLVEKMRSEPEPIPEELKKIIYKNLKTRERTYDEISWDGEKRISEKTGVHWSVSKQRWIARINIDGKRKELGEFRDEQDAIDIRVKYEEGLVNDIIEQKKISENLKSDKPGVHWSNGKQKWIARIKGRDLGKFDNELDAIAKREEYEKLYETESLVKKDIKEKIIKENSSKKVGVHRSNTKNRWLARITINGKKKDLGSFNNEEDAIARREEYERILEMEK